MKDFYNEPKTVSFFANKEPSERLSNELKKISDPGLKRALDHGCGGGRHTELLLKMGFDTFACDRSQAMLKVTRERVKNYFKQGDAGERIVFADMTSLPFQDNFFDVIVSRSVVSEAGSLNTYKLAIKELGRVLKPGGLLLLAVMTDKNVDSTLQKIEKEKYTYMSPEEIPLTLLPVPEILALAKEENLVVMEGYEEEFRESSVIPRAILRCVLSKIG